MKKRLIYLIIILNFSIFTKGQIQLLNSAFIGKWYSTDSIAIEISEKGIVGLDKINGKWEKTFYSENRTKYSFLDTTLINTSHKFESWVVSSFVKLGKDIVYSDGTKGYEYIQTAEFSFCKIKLIKHNKIKLTITKISNIDAFNENPTLSITSTMKEKLLKKEGNENILILTRIIK